MGGRARGLSSNSGGVALPWFPVPVLRRSAVPTQSAGSGDWPTREPLCAGSAASRRRASFARSVAGFRFRLVLPYQIATCRSPRAAVEREGARRAGRCSGGRRSGGAERRRRTQAAGVRGRSVPQACPAPKGRTADRSGASRTGADRSGTRESGARRGAGITGRADFPCTSEPGRGTEIANVTLRRYV